MRAITSLSMRAWLCVVMAATLGSLGGCSSDSAPEPEPEVETPGAFVAVDENLGYLKLYRTLSPYEVGVGATLLIVTIYSVQPATYEEAKAMAQGPEPVIGVPADFVVLSDILERPHEVVWMRTLTRDEILRIP
jgi:hypothetical protein